MLLLTAAFLIGQAPHEQMCQALAGADLSQFHVADVHRVCRRCLGCALAGASRADQTDIGVQRHLPAHQRRQHHSWRCHSRYTGQHDPEHSPR